MSIEDLISLSRKKLTDKELAERQQKFEERLREMDLENIERNRCKICGVDTINFSHTFSCAWRGI